MITNVLLFLLNIAVVVPIIGGMWKIQSGRWSRLAAAYRAAGPTPVVAKRHLQTIILEESVIKYNTYRGIATVGVSPVGIRIELMFPYSLFHPPLLIPYAGLDFEPRRWYLIGKTYQCRLPAAADVRIILHDDLVHWIESCAAEMSMATS